MQALILAAGKGTRLKNLTADRPKALLPFLGSTLLQRNLDLLSRISGMREAIVVTGYRAEQIREVIGENYDGLPIRYVHNPLYESTNNIYSLWLARTELKEDFLLLECDVAFHPRILDLALAHPGESVVLVDKYQPWMDGTVVEMVGDTVRMVNKAEQRSGSFRYEHAYKTLNIYKFQIDFFRNVILPNLEIYLTNVGTNAYYETVLAPILYWRHPSMKVVDVGDLPWYEIDDALDLARAEYLFLSPEGKYARVLNNRGGYWRESFLDFAYLYNLYYPAPGYFRHLEEVLPQLVRHYPSGWERLRSMLSGWVGLPAEHVFPANGSAEILRHLVEGVGERVVLPVPTFHEYERVLGDRVCPLFLREADGFALDPARLVAEVRRCGADALVLVNPNNPTGSVLPGAALREILHELADLRSIVVDESFLDFAEDAESTSLVREVPRYRNVVLVKSISKAYGVPGLRLGFCAAGDPSRLRVLQERLPIWNVNSLAEDFLEYQVKHQEEFVRSCSLVRRDRQELWEQLRRIPGIRPYPSQANFLLCRITRSMSSREVAYRLFAEHGILVKDCGGKRGLSDRFIRVAVRTRAENARLLSALHAVLNPPLPQVAGV